MHRFFVIGLFCAVAAGTARAQSLVTVEIVPPAPTTHRSVTIVVNTNTAIGMAELTRTGNVFRFDVSGGVIGPPPAPIRQEFAIGFLPSGTYIYEVYVEGQPDATGSFAVVAEAVPALSAPARLLLMMAIAAIGTLVAVRR
jgi:hypothetical protein